MRLSGIDMMIGIGFLLPGVCLANWALHQREAYSLAVALVAMALTIIAYVVGGSWLYQALRFSPMSVPHCPHCQTQGPFSYHLHRDVCYGFLCAHCEGYFEVWLGKTPQEHVPSGYAELVVRFPYHFGGYALLHSEQLGKVVTADESTPPMKGIFEVGERATEELLLEALNLWPDFITDDAGRYVDSHGLLRFFLTDTGLEVELQRSYHHGVNARQLHRFYRLGCWVRERYPDAVWRGSDGEVLELAAVIG